jgi:hypothetical protein
MLRVVFWCFVVLLLAAAGGAYYLLECGCEVPSVAHAPFLPPADPTVPVITSPKTAADWAAVTRQDLAAARRYLEQNSPIPFDAENPQLERWMVTGYEQALARSQQVTNLPGYSATMLGYINGFQDPHIQFGVDGKPPQGRWPGFIVSRRGDVGEIIDRDEGPGVPAVGTKVLGCDGKSLDQLAAERILPFRFNSDIPPQRRAAVTRLFLDRQNPFGPPPQVCDMEINGKRQAVALNWHDLPQDEEAWSKRYAVATFGPEAPWGVSEPAPGVTWIGVPTFSSGDDTAPKLDALIKQAEARGIAMRQGKAIIIDVRGNGGGNSSWADKLAAAVFTQAVLDVHPAPARESAIDWRASADNGAYWHDWSAQMAKEFGPYSWNRLESLLIGRQLARFANSNPPIWRFGSCKPSRSGGWSKQRPQGPSPFPAKVYMLSDGNCGSSCLNFADEVLMVPGVKLIGSSTSADGALMEVRDVKLPSTFSGMTIPQKVERGAGRAPMEAYAADVAYDGLWSDEAVRAWVMGLVADGK